MEDKYIFCWAIRLWHAVFGAKGWTCHSGQQFQVLQSRRTFIYVRHTLPVRFVHLLLIYSRTVKLLSSFSVRHWTCIMYDRSGLQIYVLPFLLEFLRSRTTLALKMKNLPTHFRFHWHCFRNVLVKQATVFTCRDILDVVSLKSVGHLTKLTSCWCLVLTCWTWKWNFGQLSTLTETDEVFSPE